MGARGAAHDHRHGHDGACEMAPRWRIGAEPESPGLGEETDELDRVARVGRRPTFQVNVRFAGTSRA